MDKLLAISESLRKGNSIETRRNVIAAINAGFTYKEILEPMLDVMKVVGDQFKKNELFIPEVLIVGRAFNIALDVLAPLLKDDDHCVGTLVIGTVRGDLHNIGKNLVKIFMVGAGLNVIDLGVDVSPRAFVEAIKTHQPDFVAMSALLTTTMVQINQTIKEINKEGLRDQVKIIIGGAPITSDFANNVGADFYAPDAASAVDMVRNYLKEKK